MINNIDNIEEMQILPANQVDNAENNEKEKTKQKKPTGKIQSKKK